MIECTKMEPASTMSLRILGMNLKDSIVVLIEREFIINMMLIRAIKPVKKSLSVLQLLIKNFLPD